MTLDLTTISTKLDALMKNKNCASLAFKKDEFANYIS